MNNAAGGLYCTFSQTIRTRMVFRRQTVINAGVCSHILHELIYKFRPVIALNDTRKTKIAAYSEESFGHKRSRLVAKMPQQTTPAVDIR